jgi:hypothetical protein
MELVEPDVNSAGVTVTTTHKKEIKKLRYN